MYDSNSSYVFDLQINVMEIFIILCIDLKFFSPKILKF
jgi:hypothetical protein